MTSKTNKIVKFIQKVLDIIRILVYNFPAEIKERNKNYERDQNSPYCW